MLTRAEVLVLRKLRYGDNSLILTTFSRECGLLSFIVSLSKRSKNGLRPANFQVLTLLELVYYEKQKSQLKRLKEARMVETYQRIPYEPVHSSIALFLAEILQHVLREEEAQERLYDFLKEALLHLDALRTGLGKFPLAILMHLSRHLGFGPEEQAGDQVYFDLVEGKYSRESIAHPHYIEGRVKEAWSALSRLPWAEHQELDLQGASKRALLEALLDYYRLHLTDFGTLRSLEVLRAVLH